MTDTTALEPMEVVLDPETLEGVEDITVEVSDETGELGEMATTEESALTPQSAHDENLAAKMSETELAGIATELLQLFEEDKESRADWDARFARGMALLGLTEDKDRAKPFPTASNAVHPVLLEAMVQFNSRAITELWPSGGPVKAQVIGESTPAKEEQRSRIESHMNYQYVEEMPEAFDEQDKLTFRVSYEGMSFKKVFYDRLLGRMRSIYRSGRNIVVPYNAQGLEQSPRVSDEYTVTHNTLLKRMQVGDWLKVEIAEPEATTSEEGGDKAIADTEGRRPTGMSAGEHDIIEMQVYYDLPGHKDLDAEGKPTGIGLPYLVTLHKTEQRVLAIRRDWDEQDKFRKRLQCLTPYGFVPGFGFYYLGFIHMIGGLAEATTGSVRALLDSAQFAAAQGGFKSKEARTAKGEVTLEPGKWKDVDLTADEMKNGFFTPPYKEPPMVLFNLLGALVEYARRFASTTEAMVGDANNNGPVGTTLALIEQGMKVFSAIHKRMHNAQMNEFRILARLNAKHLPNMRSITYGENVFDISAKDYDGRIDVRPVSDPNIFSQTQRIALAQSVLALAEKAPNLYDMREAHKLMLEAMNVGNQRMKTLLPDPERDIMPLDPVTESQMFLMGKPVRAFSHQNHEAHIAVHQGFLNQLPPELQQQIAPMHMAHIAEHYAHAFRVQIETQLDAIGLDVPPLQRPSMVKVGSEPVVRPVMPDIDDMVAQAVAQMMIQAGATQAPGQPQKDPETIKAEAEAARKDMLAQREADRKDKLAARDIARTDEKFKQQLELKDADAAHKVIQEAGESKEMEEGDE